MKVEGFHNNTGQWITLYDADRIPWNARTFVDGFASGGASHATINNLTVNRTHFSAFRIVGNKLEDETDIPF